MGEELYKYKAYISTGITFVATLIISVLEFKFPDYVIAPISLVIAIAICRYAAYRQLEGERRSAEKMSRDIISSAEKINSIITASKEEEKDHFEKSRKALDGMLAAHVEEIQSQYLEKKENIKRLESHQNKMSDEMFNAVKNVDSSVRGKSSG